MLCALAGTVLGIPALLRYQAHRNFYVWLQPGGDYASDSPRMQATYLAQGAISDTMVHSLAASIGLGAAYVVLALVRWPLWTLADRSVDVQPAAGKPRPACVEDRCFVLPNGYGGYLFALPPSECLACTLCKADFDPPRLRRWWSPPCRRGLKLEMQPRLWAFQCGHTFHPDCLDPRFSQGAMYCPTCLLGEEKGDVDGKAGYADEETGCADEKTGAPGLGYMV